MPYDGKFTDYFEARCRKAQDDRALLSVRDLLRLGPYRGDSWHHDVVTFSSRLAHRLKGKQFPVGFLLRDELNDVVRDPTRSALLFVRKQLVMPETTRHLPHALHQAAILRLDFYLAAIGHERSIEQTILRCLDLATTARTPEIEFDYIRATLGWALILKHLNWPKFSSAIQADVSAAGETMLKAIFSEMAKRYVGGGK